MGTPNHPGFTIGVRFSFLVSCTKVNTHIGWHPFSVLLVGLASLKTHGHFGKNDVVKISVQAVGGEVPPEESETSTRDRVARSILEQGPSTAGELAERLELTPAAVRRHLTLLCETGHLDSRDRPVIGARGRGRPAKEFFLTDSGRNVFYHAYDRLASDAMAFLLERLGPSWLTEFAERTQASLAQRLGGETVVEARDLVSALNEEGYIASLSPVASGQQLCQHHCPVAHVARDFPELCEAETELFSRLLGTHLQRLATIAHGHGVCTTHIPASPDRKANP